MSDYDLSAAFEEIENDLIASMMRNLKRHQAEETKLGYEWSQWQVLQLKAMEQYRRENLSKFQPRFSKLNAQIADMLKSSYSDGSTEQERKILQAIRRGFKGVGKNAPAFTGSAEVDGGFFGINDRKLNALIEATTHDMQRAEYAVLRRANDRYRKTIFNAQAFLNTGAGTYEQAVDMATRDFLRAGLDSIEYKNGSRHTIAEYSEMALRTAGKRAYLQGEGAMREEWGISTVIINKRTNACPLCAQWVGRVLIDDVWSGGTAKDTDGKYPLMSEAIAAGLYHPNCRDVHTTYFEGISSPPEGYTDEERAKLVEDYNRGQKQGYYSRQAKRYSRMSKFSLDEENKRKYKAKADNYRQLAKAFDSTAEKTAKAAAETVQKTVSKTIEKSAESGIIKAGKYDLSKSVMLPESLINSTAVPDDIKQNISDVLDKIKNDFGISIEEIEYAPYYENPKAPYTFIPYSDNGKYKAKLNVNTLFSWNKSLSEFDDRIYNKNYLPGILASKTSADLLYHEAAHFKTFEDCETFSDFMTKERTVRRVWIRGISGYSDASSDGAEAIAEAFVKWKNKENLSEEAVQLLEQYIF